MTSIRGQEYPKCQIQPDNLLIGTARWAVLLLPRVKDPATTTSYGTPPRNHSGIDPDKSGVDPLARSRQQKRTYIAQWQSIRFHNLKVRVQIPL